jgi:hypothetical protein
MKLSRLDPNFHIPQPRHCSLQGSWRDFVVLCCGVSRVVTFLLQRSLRAAFTPTVSSMPKLATREPFWPLPRRRYVMGV